MLLPSLAASLPEAAEAQGLGDHSEVAVAGFEKPRMVTARSKMWAPHGPKQEVWSVASASQPGDGDSPLGTATQLPDTARL